MKSKILIIMCSNLLLILIGCAKNDYYPILKGPYLGQTPPGKTAEIFNPGIFPEGERTKTGKMNPFKLGIGIIASNMKVPIVPIKLEGLFEILPRNCNFPKKRGKVTLKIGKPLYERKCEAFSKYKGLGNQRFPKPLYFTNESYIDITKKIEATIKSL